MRHIYIDESGIVIDITKLEEEMDMENVKKYAENRKKEEDKYNSKLSKFKRGVGATIKNRENWAFQMKGAAVTGVVMGAADYIMNKDVKSAFDMATRVAAKQTIGAMAVQSGLNGLASTKVDGYVEYLEGEI